MKDTKVLVVIESRFVGDVFTDVLADEIDITVAGCATTISQARDIVREHEIDVALVSIHLPGALELIRVIKENAPSTKILALGLLDNENQVLRCVEAGAAGYILQDSSVYDLIKAIGWQKEKKPRYHLTLPGRSLTVSQNCQNFSRESTKSTSKKTR